MKVKGKQLDYKITMNEPFLRRSIMGNSIPEKKGTEMNRRRNYLLGLAATVFCMILWFGTDVYAQGRVPCVEDIAKFCKDVQPGGGRIVRCLKEHESELSPECNERLAQPRKRK